MLPRGVDRGMRPRGMTPKRVAAAYTAAHTTQVRARIRAILARCVVFDKQGFLITVCFDTGVRVLRERQEKTLVKAYDSNYILHIDYLH